MADEQILMKESSDSDCIMPSRSEIKWLHATLTVL